MRNILKGIRKVDAYIFPEADTIEMDEEKEELPEPPPEETGEDAPAPDITAPDEEAEEPPEEPEPDAPEPQRAPPGPDTPVQYAQLQAELILKQAREEAEQFVEQARAEVQQELDGIRAGARDEGYREGYAQGTAKAMEDAIRDREAAAERMEKDVAEFLEKASLAREEMLGQTREEMLDLCIAIAEKVVRVSLRSSSEVIVRMIQTATERMKRQEWVHIYIPGCDARGVAQISPALTTTLGASPSISR